MRVYKIDLMKFSLLKRNLKNITKINLAGIRPYHEATIELGDGKDYRDRKHSLALPLEEEGAYLVVCRGEDLHASGLVLVSPLVVDVQEDAASGRVRATVKDDLGREVAMPAYVADVHVKVIGSENDAFTAGETDLRGVFVADGIPARRPSSPRPPVASTPFFRGKTSAPRPAGERAGRQQQGEEQPASENEKRPAAKRSY